MRTAAERQQLIDSQKEEVRTQDGQPRTKRLWVRDMWRDYPVHRVPVDALVLNADNRRFRAERMQAEEWLGRQLDPENYPDDERTVESLLLDSSHRIEGDRITGNPTTAYESLRDDWLQRGQEEPFWIRPDGTVRNGNRRLAMIRRRQREHGDSGLQWIEAVILDPSEIDEPALLEMEQHEQLTENFKLRYNDIDYLLALKEAAVNRDIDWYDRGSLEEVAGELQTMVEKSKSEVLRDLFAIRYMDEFLHDSEQPGEYHRLLRTLERFRDIGRAMMWVEDEYPLQAAEVLQVLFAAVRAGTTHTDIRKLRRIFRSDRNRFDSLVAEIGSTEEAWNAADGPRLLPVPGSEEIEDDDNEEDTGPNVEGYPKDQVATAIKVAIDGFEASQQNEVPRLLREIRNRLEVLSSNNLLVEAFARNRDEIVVELEPILDWAITHQELLKTDDGS